MTEERLNHIESELRQLRSENRSLSENLSQLNQFANELLDIATTHQQALRIIQSENQRDREQFQAEILRIWQYLLNQTGNGSGD